MRVKIKKRPVFKISNEPEEPKKELSAAEKLALVQEEMKILEEQELDMTGRGGKKKPPEKPPKRKRSIHGRAGMAQRIEDNLAPSAMMKKLHEEWVKKIGETYSGAYNVIIEDQIDRVDIMDKNDDGTKWRLCIVGLNMGEVDASLFFKGKPDRMQPTISFLNIPAKDAVNIVGDMLTMQRTYSF